MKLNVFVPLLMLGCLSSTTVGTRAERVATPDESSILRLDVQARVDWQGLWYDGATSRENTGFEGKYLALRLDGTITRGLSYSWRQRLNKLHGDYNFFDAADWIYLNYNVDGWNFQAGKEIVAIGGYEYDLAPVDIFANSIFCSNIPCYDLGVSVGYDLGSNDRLTAQVTQSPFFTRDDRNMYAYNLMWNGRHGVYESIFSVNLLEYARGHYINYIALGNKFNLGKVQITADLTNRASSHQGFLFKDCTVTAEVVYSPAAAWRIHAKGSYDVNKSGTAADAVVVNGTEYKMAGALAEFYPLRRDRTSLRIHAGCFYGWGSNGNTADFWQDRSLFATVGLTWDMNVLNLRRK